MTLPYYTRRRAEELLTAVYEALATMRENLEGCVDELRAYLLEGADDAGDLSPIYHRAPPVSELVGLLSAAGRQLDALTDHADTLGGDTGEGLRRHLQLIDAIRKVAP